MSAFGVRKRTSKFLIYRKSAGAIVLDPKTVDHEMFAHRGEQPSGMGYYFYWDEVIASRIAGGEQLDMIRAYFVDRLEQCTKSASEKARERRRNYQRLIEITDRLAQNFTLEAVPASAALSEARAHRPAGATQTRRQFPPSRNPPPWDGRLLT